MSTSTSRAETMARALSERTFAPGQPKKRAPRAAKANVTPRLDNLPHKASERPDVPPQPWNPSKSPALSRFGYTLAPHDLKSGMTVTQWPGESAHTIGSMEKPTHDSTILRYTDGTEAQVGRNASFSQGTLQR